MLAREQFTQFIIDTNPAYTAMDRIYLNNRIMALVGDDNHTIAETSDDALTLLDSLVQTATVNHVVPDRFTLEELEAELMALATPAPSAVNARFWSDYQDSPEEALKHFYQLSRANNYIQTRAIAKNTQYTVKTDYGDLEITINLSKPEKDPKAIAAAAKAPVSSYPLCQLCMTNEGYLGRINYPARGNHRIVRLNLGGRTWGFQYSPYAYFNEHAIFLDSVHQPMQITPQTFSNLLELITLFPEYMVGSNADLPIVGGSMLSHDHYQGGRHTFAMAKAPIERRFDLDAFPEVSAGIVKWPMSVIRLTSAHRDQLIQAATMIHNHWQQYSDETVDVRAFTDATPHHTVTPIARRVGDDYQIDLVLRDNQTSAEFPDGIFHPHPDVQHIKKENIGLIEVMGLAILPARLQTELQEVRHFLLSEPNQMLAMHLPWAESLQRPGITADNVEQVIDAAVGQVFLRVLEDAGVFKRNDVGQAAFDRFTQSLN
ncbi:UDP-glucose--hexose-1-phosphate uridylyltransferase [Lacticaseibacillus saniviri]